MKVIKLTQPIELPVKPLIRAYFKQKNNEQIWIQDSPKKISFTSFSVYKDKVIAETTDSKKYILLPKKSKSLYTQDTILTNCTVRQIVNGCTNQSIILEWKQLSGISSSTKMALPNDLDKVVDSIDKNVHLLQEEVDDDGNIIKGGLRAPQIGGIYAILSNLAVSKDPATVVLPTGTGKSETILSTILSKKIARSLIIVPSDGLRNQFFKGSLSWGILRKINIVTEDALNPVVCKISSSLKDDNILKDMIMTSNVVIATASILNNLSPKILSVLNKNVQMVFIDEAHHSSAPSWGTLKAKLGDTKIIQFTATPFREDGQQVHGKLIFNYALEEAQKNKFFTKIEFIPVVDYDKDNWDKTIAEKAIEVLKKDIADGHNHILMARVDEITKAKEIYEKYYQQYTEYNPILITSKSASTDKLIDKLRKGESKIVVCVNMLGEGIDIPQLKIAAFHVIRKSLTVTIQIIGRFTRSNKSKSPAKIIANIADINIEKRLKQLYKEDADWGKLIAFASAKEIQKKIKFQELLTNFKDSKIPLYNIKPKHSAVVYQAKDNHWKPEVISEYLEKNGELYLCDINEADGLAIAIYQVEEGIDWMDSKIFTENSWELLLFYFDKSKNLLYVNSSQKSVNPKLIEKIIKLDFKFEKEAPFKCYHGLGHVVLFTLGLDKNTDSPIKYAMYAGSDIYDGISEMEKNKSSKSNTYGYGYKDGEELTIGASKHGKIWSRLVGNLQEWKEWCDEIGLKLTDSSIDVGNIFKGFLQPKRFNESEFSLLSKPTSIDFPTVFYQEKESDQFLIIDGKEVSLNEVTISIRLLASGYNIDLEHEFGTSTLNLIYNDDEFNFIPENFSTIEYRKKKKVKDFIPYLKDEDTFRIRLLDGTFVENNYHFRPFKSESIFPLDTNLITSIDWQGVDISKESRNVIPPFIMNSIQERIFQLKSVQHFKIIVNDDNSGEAADLLCFGVEDDKLLIEVIHCKFNLPSNSPGSRVDDFYQLCGQAQKNVKSIPNVLRLFDHIKEREVKTQRNGGSRFLKGNLKELELLIKSNSFKRPKIKVVLVQPGLSKSKANANVLELLGSTHTLLKETLNAEFEVICS